MKCQARSLQLNPIDIELDDNALNADHRRVVAFWLELPA